MGEKPGAIITGGDFQALGVLRTLARKGIPVVLLDSDHCIARYSRYSTLFFRSPHPSLADSYVSFLLRLAKQNNLHGWVLFPNSDDAVYVLSKYKDTLEEYYRVPTPPWEVIEKVYIKKNTYQFAEKHNIPVPKTYYPRNLAELLGMDLQFPVIIKPSIRDHFYRRTKLKAIRIDNQQELVRKYNWVCSLIDPSEVLVQEYIPGGPPFLFSFCPFFKDGEVLTAIMARRARQHPMDFGHASTFAEIVHRPELHAIAERFLRLIGFYGIAEVEFLQDPRDHQYKMLEVNPRVWGWHTLAIAAGVDLPYLLYQDAVGEAFHAPSPSTNMNIKWVRLITDIPTVLIEILKGNMTLTHYLSSMKGRKEFAVFALDDPLPFFAEIALLPYLWFKRGF